MIFLGFWAPETLSSLTLSPLITLGIGFPAWTRFSFFPLTVFSALFIFFLVCGDFSLLPTQAESGATSSKDVPWLFLLHSAKWLQFCPTLQPCGDHQAPLSVGISRQEYWRGSHALLHSIFSTQGLNPRLLCPPVLASRFFTTRTTWEVPQHPSIPLNLTMNIICIT